jgi:hypothetical protein
MKILTKTIIAACVVSVCTVLISGLAIGSPVADPRPVPLPTPTPTQGPWAPQGKIEPLNNTTAPNPPMLSWKPALVPSSYQYCVNTALGCASPSGWITVATSTKVQLPNPLNTATCYYWQVRALNAHGTTYADYNSWWVFAAGKPSPPAKISPKNGATNQSTSLALLWQPSACGATAYSYCVSKTAPPKNLCVLQGQVPASAITMTLSGLKPATTYYWQIGAYSGAALNQWTYADGNAWWKFTTRAK